ncbi:MAG TPA: Holliday junction branch migration protein RuvA [Candidatus Binatia bacterium]
MKLVPSVERLPKIESQPHARQKVIAQISGTLAQKVPGEIVVDVVGVGYQIFIPLNVFYRLPDIGAPVSLQIHTHVRDDALQLFGFQDLAEKQIFLLLISVSGIGPKLAVNILSGIPAEELARALRVGDQARLVAIPGVGRKLAERMIVELKDKLATLSAAGVESPKPEIGSQVMQDAVSALVNLGYKRPEAEKTVREVLKSGDRSLENVLKDTLRRLSP